MAKGKQAVSNIIRGAMAAVIVLVIYGGLLALTFFLTRLREEIGAIPMTLILVGGLLAILAGHVRQHSVEANTFRATARLTFRNAMHDKHTFSLAARAFEWLVLSLAAIGIAVALDKL